MEDLDPGPACIPGTPLAEVFTVIVNTYGRKCELYGTIKVEDDKGIVCIYDIDPEDADPINQSGRLSLDNMDRAISATCFTVNLDIKDKNDGDAEFI